MGDRLTASASGLINADPAAIWAVITDPGQLGQAFFGAKVDTDWRVGSPITYRGEWEGKSFEDKGEIVKFEAEQALAVHPLQPAQRPARHSGELPHSHLRASTPR